jgi:hypothetical protein
MSFPVRAKPYVTPIATAGSRQPSGRNASPSGIRSARPLRAGGKANAIARGGAVSASKGGPTDEEPVSPERR